jgi:hypothetical protein
MEKKVKIKDYQEKQHLMLIALNMVGFNVDYVNVDLINSVLLKLSEKGGKMDMLDAINIKNSHEIKWQNYFDKQVV